MSRSRRYTPIWKDRNPFRKWKARRRYRHVSNYVLKSCVDYDYLLIPLVRAVTCVCEWSDYAFWVDSTRYKYLRK
jgi:hypothetical protein